ncbi:MAG: chitooligosaccharide deacetylase [Candidatus Margulisiibacteriota bacterium]|nr:MAG: hypothetical protein A2X43_00865 [Candidatus Margulisbacteria bacterium GWD2_39_127]OGI02382.1 MAG: hypothetical protein A2X42_09515 [Candidatus Margulisbacteria bacterium GWF2_38_17]OGI08515.1 MAG: hypothetical protein A2X41_07305 [Candidatus Margulisbacteria bacterium GWE2_39_32]PZM77205.1 MAG: chitooligosaccharide deacetylase [Candidatus Margulisiibacteriota bacterium]HAR63424.1 chitooligosaccharide deacetylase [Candidatus Margulisiibacteriota bacterium]
MRYLLSLALVFFLPLYGYSEIRKVGTLIPSKNSTRYHPVKVQKPIFSGSHRRPRVALTLDDGQHCDYRILELLVSYNIRCTAFIKGDVAEKNKRLIKKLDEMHWEICNHTYSHAYLTRESDREIVTDIKKAQGFIYKTTGKFYPYLRPPYGKYNKRVNVLAAQLGYRLVLWDNSLCDTGKTASTDKQVRFVEQHLRNGNIILCHFGGLNTYEVLKIIIPEILRRGYTFCTISELLAG